MSSQPGTPDTNLDECLTCGEVEGVENECPKSQRPCGHHCNHTWTHDCCHWCGAEMNDEGELVVPGEGGVWSDE